ncbi:MAG: restriction endonuclease subunit S [Muribaculaceae bacterium]|nr:restriction endonuclease subunit S [Muribaculaceae bacterium]MCM1560208.1 restriction endonuclease subunit S [Butyrivibrio sp.]
MSWEKVKLKELYEVHNGLSKASKFFGTGFPFLSFSTVFNNYFIPDEITDLVQSTEKEQKNYSIKCGDVFVTRTSETANELGMSCVALKDYPQATYNGFTKRMRPVTDKLLPKYVGYYMRLPSFRAGFQAFSTMTTRASLRNEDLLGLQIAVPPIAVQKKIAGILTAYDDLIENNKKQIKLLEEMSQRLYKEWFVDLHFPGYEDIEIVDGVPEGWRKEKLIDLCDVQYGYAFDGAFFNDKRKGTPIIRIRNIPTGTSNDYTTEHADERYIIKNGEIIVGMDGEFHINSWSGENAYLVQRVCCFRPHDEIIRGWLLWALYEPIKYFEKTVVGATVSHLGKKHIDMIEVLKAPRRLYVPFDICFKRRQLLLNQNRKLLEVRERLLSKLMNREIEV